MGENRKWHLSGLQAIVTGNWVVVLHDGEGGFGNAVACKQGSLLFGTQHLVGGHKLYS